ncbi:hypothetical protein [Variovorax rhizosphaerae]|uniref:Uncharacterized protein n=1 Tax=Variovorax rhizosphaerae TaxID=1836200 RepID=A0ABU8WMB6_9BURK
MEHNFRPFNVIHAELVRAMDLLAAVGFDTEGAIYQSTLQRVMRLVMEFRVAEDAAMRAAESVASDLFYRYTGGRLLEIDEGE